MMGFFLVSEIKHLHVSRCLYLYSVGGPIHFAMFRTYTHCGCYFKFKMVYIICLSFTKKNIL